MEKVVFTKDNIDNLLSQLAKEKSQGIIILYRECLETPHFGVDCI